MKAKSNKTDPLAAPEHPLDGLIDGVAAVVERVDQDAAVEKQAVLNGLAPDLQRAKEEREALEQLGTLHRPRLEKVLHLLEDDSLAAYPPIVVEHVVKARTLSTKMVKSLRDIPAQLAGAEAAAAGLTASQHNMLGEAGRIRVDIKNAGRPSERFPQWLEELQHELEAIAQNARKGHLSSPVPIVAPAEPEVRETHAVGSLIER